MNIVAFKYLMYVCAPKEQVERQIQQDNATHSLLGCEQSMSDLEREIEGHIRIRNKYDYLLDQCMQDNDRLRTNLERGNK